MERCIAKPLVDKILSETENYKTLEKLKQHMESMERKLCDKQPSMNKTEKN